MKFFGKITETFNSIKRMEAKFASPVIYDQRTIANLTQSDLANAEQFRIIAEDAFIFGVHKFGDRNKTVI